MYEMYPEAYKEWIEIFNDDLLEVWGKERKELQKTAMLLNALQRELKNVQTSVEVEIINIRQQLNQKDDLRERKNSILQYNEGKKKSPTAINKENEYDSELVGTAEILEDISNFNESESPDLFRNVISQSPAENRVETSVIDLSLSDEDVALADGSPTIKRRRKYHNKSKIPAPGFDMRNNPKWSVNKPAKAVFDKDSFKVNLFKTPTARSDNDLSVIESTPEIPIKTLHTNSKVGERKLKKKAKGAKAGNTLTQMFERSKRKLEVTTNKEGGHDEDSDETYFEEGKEASKLGITDLLNFVNNDEATRLEEKSSMVDRVSDETTFCDLNMDSSEEIDEFSKGAIFNETEITTPTEKPKFIPPEPELVIRGKARQQLQGWACEQCKNFYSTMRLSPKELKKKMDECSRHRYKYNPPPETLPGFWDLSIPPEGSK